VSRLPGSYGASTCAAVTCHQLQRQPYVPPTLKTRVFVNCSGLPSSSTTDETAATVSDGQTRTEPGTIVLSAGCASRAACKKVSRSSSGFEGSERRRGEVVREDTAEEFGPGHPLAIAMSLGLEHEYVQLFDLHRSLPSFPLGLSSGSASSRASCSTPVRQLSLRSTTSNARPDHPGPRPIDAWRPSHTTVEPSIQRARRNPRVAFTPARGRASSAR
jgi:hypothetical protein